MNTVQLARNVQNVLVNGATGVGTSQSAPFNQAYVTTVPDDGVLQAQAIPTGTFSSLTLTLQLSSDGGVTWSQVGNIWDAVSEPVTEMQISGPAVDPNTGLPVAYRLSVTTFVGGTSIVVKGWIAPLGPQFVENGPTSDVTAFQGGAWAVSITEGGNTAVVTAAGAVKVDGSGVTLTTEDLATNLIGNPVVPDAIQIGYEDGSGNTQIPSAAAPLPVTIISGGGSNDSVGLNGTTAPTSSTQMGVQGSDDLVALRTCDTFNTFQSQGGTPGQQGIWTPASGKKFRLMKLWVTVSGNANTTGGGLLTVYFTDGPAGAVVGPTFDVWIQPPTTANSTGYFDGFLMSTGLVDMGNGYLSAGANTTLYLNTSLQLTAGYIRVNTFGTEE